MNGSQSTPAYTTGFVTSQDGTTIGYRQMGQGPGVILMHGGMQASQNFMKLGLVLCDEFTVFIPDRRGRGLSAGFAYTSQAAVEDVKALLDKTGAHNLFGLSSGALIALRAALALPEIRKLALYEPPLSINGSTPTAWLARFDREIAQGNVAAAMITAMKGTQDSSFFTALPQAISAPLMNLASKAQAKEIKGDDVPLEQLIPTMHYDMELVIETENSLANYAGVSADVLLLGGSKSQKFLKYTLDQLAAVLPHVRRVELAGLDHVAADNDGQPERVAEELRRFFGDSD